MYSRHVFVFVISLVVSVAAIGQDDSSKVLRYVGYFHSNNNLDNFYRNLGYQSIWQSKASVNELISVIALAGYEGLDPLEYHYEDLLKIRDGHFESEYADVLLTDAYLTYAEHLKYGRLDPSLLFPADWDAIKHNVDFEIELLQALNDENIAGSLESFKPKDALYCNLKSSLQLLMREPGCDSIDVYKRKVIANLEKCRWRQEIVSSNYVVVNIPSFDLRLFRRDSCLMEMKAMVGRPERKTPIINSFITSVIINPEWTVPPTILKEDMLPAVQKNRDYLKNNNLRLIDHDGIEVKPDSLPWSSYSASNFPFTIRQDAGVRSALGLFKFQFANTHGVYMHDTNVHSLFSQTSRAFSSGCIRIERPLALATHLLGNTAWDEKRLQELVSSGKTTSINLKERVQIQTTYFTLVINASGELEQVKDIYNWDPIIAGQLIRQAANLPGRLRLDNK